jgi:hypothetical protein
VDCARFFRGNLYEWCSAGGSIGCGLLRHGNGINVVADIADVAQKVRLTAEEVGQFPGSGSQILVSVDGRVNA